MIKFEKNAELDMAMRNLIESMIDEGGYLSSILSYMGAPLALKTKKEVLRILKRSDIPAVIESGSMWDGIENCHGRCPTLGLGIGRLHKPRIRIREDIDFL